ncbi:MAG: competence/damage-inducible protein A [Alcaligenaceae bacterium]|jgi:molybdopterin-biosynthesis enzyme MoeA-like protein|nr:competence/damage-inducible protein A [Alcaligenaceae bacterium]
MPKSRKFGLIIVGDEILSGRRQDKHLSKVIELLSERGMELSWARLVGDDMDELVRIYKESFASGDIVFSTGGIGATPDDKTREAAAKALGVPMVLHPEAEALIMEYVVSRASIGKIDQDIGAPENQRRLAMGVFPEGAEIVPNDFNRIPGFFIKDHTFVPGFPEMAWSMFEWVLDNKYLALQNNPTKSLAVNVYHLPESRIAPSLEEIEVRWPDVNTFSLPKMPTADAPGYIDLGVRSKNEEALKAAYDFLRGEVLRVGGRFNY